MSKENVWDNSSNVYEFVKNMKQNSYEMFKIHLGKKKDFFFFFSTEISSYLSDLSTEIFLYLSDLNIISCSLSFSYDVTV